MLQNHNINDLNGGVSQQPTESRFDNQVESMDNFMVTTAQGLRRRNPISLLSKLDVEHHNDIGIHSYERGDGDKQYGMTLCEHGLKIYDPENPSTAKTVHIIGDSPVYKWHLSGTDWKKDIEFVTVGDTTWVLNKSIVVEKTESGVSQIQQAFYWINKSYSDGSNEGGTSHGHAYEVVLNGTTFRAVYPTDAQWLAWGSTNEERASNWGFSYRAITGYKDLTESEIVGLTFSDSILAAKALSRYINLHPDFTAESQGSIIRIKHSSLHDFDFEYGDSWGNQASKGWTESVSKLSDLPSSLDGFNENDIGTVAISGTDTDNFTNYYLDWVGGKWIETHAVGFDTTLNKDTLPAKLVQVDDNTFEFGFVDEYEASDSPYTGSAATDNFLARWSNKWSQRLKGDEDSNPIPSFVGRTISNIFFFKNRLGFTSEDNVILSESGSYYNFFATTAMEVLDSDPIDAGIDSNTVSIIKNVNTTAGALTLWADDSQFLLSGGEILSPATTRIGQTSSYAVSNEIPPISVDNEILFFNKKGQYLEVLSYNPASLQADKSSAESISSHIPEYIPSDIDTAVVSPAYNMVFLFSKSHNDTVYVYKYYVHNGERKISAWFTWTFNETIVDIEVLNDKLYLLANLDDLFVLELEPLELDGVFLDERTDSKFKPYESNVIMSRYNMMTNQNTMTFREPFYMKNIKVKKQGKVDFVIINNERDNETVVNNKHLGRKLVVGGNTSKVNTGFRTSYDVGCEINTISLEGRVHLKSRNI